MRADDAVVRGLEVRAPRYYYKDRLHVQYVTPRNVHCHAHIRQSHIVVYVLIY